MYFGYLNMPRSVFGNGSNNSENIKDTSMFVQKIYFRTKYIETYIEEDVDLKNQYGIKNLPNPLSIRKAASKNYVDNKFNDPSITKNSTHVDFNDKNLDNVRFVKVNSLPAVREHLTPKIYVDETVSHSVNESSLSTVNHYETLRLNKQGSIVLCYILTSPKTRIEIPTKSYVDSSHEINGKGRDFLSVFYDPDNEFDIIKLTTLDSITVDVELNSDNELASKNYEEYSIGQGNLVGFNLTLENYLKVSVGNDTNNLTKYNKIQVTDTTFNI